MKAVNFLKKRGTETTWFCNGCGYPLVEGERWSKHGSQLLHCPNCNGEIVKWKELEDQTCHLNFVKQGDLACRIAICDNCNDELIIGLEHSYPNFCSNCGAVVSFEASTQIFLDDVPENDKLEKGTALICLLCEVIAKMGVAYGKASNI